MGNPLPEKRGRIDDKKLFRLVVERGLSQRHAALFFGVSEAAVSKRMKILGLDRHRRSTAIAHINAASERGLDVIGELRQKYGEINTEFEWAVAEARKPNGDRRDFQDTIVRLSSETRKYLSLGLNVLEALHTIDEVGRFQREVLDVVGEVVPEIREEIIRSLATRRTLRTVAQLPG